MSGRRPVVSDRAGTGGRRWSASLSSRCRRRQRGRSRWTTRLLAREFGLTSGCVFGRAECFRCELKPHFVAHIQGEPRPRVRREGGRTSWVCTWRRRNTPSSSPSTRKHPFKPSSARNSRASVAHGTRATPHARLQAPRRRRPLRCAGHRDRQGHSSGYRLPYGHRLPRLHEQGRPRVSVTQELHVILDNSSSHSTPEVKAWLEQHPQVQFHFTPTSASWLNQVEGFFGILGKAISR